MEEYDGEEGSSEPLSEEELMAIATNRYSEIKKK